MLVNGNGNGNGGVQIYDAKNATSDYFFTGSMDTISLEFDPLVTGYAFIKWTAFPKWVYDSYEGFFDLTEKNFKEFSGLSDIEMEASPMTIGFAGNEYNVATGIKKGNTDFSLRHQEFSGSPIKNGYQFWVSGIRDPETGIATYPAIFGCDYAAKNHTGELIYIVTRPDANNVNKSNIEFACYYTAVMPTKIPISHFTYSSGTHDLPEIEQSFKGNFHTSKKVDEFAQSVLANDVYGFIELGEFNPNDAESPANVTAGYAPSADDQQVEPSDLTLNQKMTISSGR